MKRLLLLLLVALYGCGLSNSPRPTASPTPMVATITPTAALIAPLPTAALGDVQNPVILSLAPAPRVDADALNASKVLIAALEKSTGYQFITIAPTTETDLVNRFQNGNAHIGVLSPFGYLLASENGSVDAAFARQQDGNAFYGAQFIARSDAGFLPYFDSVKNENTADVFDRAGAISK